MRLIDQPTINQWIPVSERLPSEYGNYLVSTKDDRVLECDIGTYCDWLGRWNGCDANGIVRNIEVIAWMPLPSPFKESEE